MMEPGENMNDFDDLAKEGWFKMNDLLNQNLPHSRKEHGPLFLRKPFLLAAAIAILLVTGLSVFYFSDQQMREAKTVANKENFYKSDQKTEKTTPLESVSPTLINAKKNSTPRDLPIISRYSTTRLVNAFDEKKFLDSLAYATVMKAVPAKETIPLKSVLKKTDSVKFEPHFKLTDSRNPNRKKVQLFAGAGINFSNNRMLSLENINIHPSIRAVIPVNSNWGIHAGLSVFSALHGSYKNEGEIEYVNNVVDNVLYKISTTSVVKVKYYDLPISLHYKVSECLTAGAGVQFSKLQKMDVSEKKESFDYNNNLTATNTERFTSSSASVYGSYEKKIEAREWDNRLILESTWKKDRFLISAGYIHGLNPAIKLLQTDGSRTNYRNSYFKVGVQYQLR